MKRIRKDLIIEEDQIEFMKVRTEFARGNLKLYVNTIKCLDNYRFITKLLDTYIFNGLKYLKFRLEGIKQSVI